MPLLARMLAAPLVIDVRPGAVASLGDLLADSRIAMSGRVAVAVGPSQGASIAADLDIPEAEIFPVGDGTHGTAVTLGKRLRAGAYEAVAGIGGGRTIDVTKFAAHMAGIPMVAVPPTWPTTESPRRSARLSTSRARGPTAWCCRWPWWWTWTGSAARPTPWTGPASAT